MDTLQAAYVVCVAGHWLAGYSDFTQEPLEVLFENLGEKCE